MYQQKKYPIGFVAHRTGLSPHLIRKWEERYGAVEPVRSNTNRRLYSEADIDRLSLLSGATQRGYAISQIAGMDDRELNVLFAGDPEAGQQPPPVPAGVLDSGAEGRAAHWLAQCQAAVKAFQGERLMDCLSVARVELSQPHLLEHLIAPLMHWIGENWRVGNIRIGQEHMATAVIKRFLSELVSAWKTIGRGPAIVITTPAGEMHEVGALIAAVMSKAEGWRPIYLGPNMPAEEIANTAIAVEAKAIALSVVYSGDLEGILEELRALTRFLPGNIGVLLGGRLAGMMVEQVPGLNARVVSDAISFRNALRAITDTPPGKQNDAGGGIQQTA